MAMFCCQSYITRHVLECIYVWLPGTPNCAALIAHIFMGLSMSPFVESCPHCTLAPGALTVDLFVALSTLELDWRLAKAFGEML